MLDIVNAQNARVDTDGPLVTDLPAGAAGAAVLPGSAAAAAAAAVATGDIRSRSDALYLMGKGPAQPAGSVVSVRISGLPVRSVVWRYAAVTAAVVIVLTAALLMISATPPAQQRQRQTERRDEFFLAMALPA